MLRFSRVRAFSALAIVVALAVSASSFGQATTNDPKEREVQQQVLAATQTYNSGDIQGAIRAFESLHAEHPQNVDVQAWLGFLYLRTDQAAKAVPLLEQAAQARPKDLEIAMNLGNAYMATDADEKAITQFESISAMDATMFEPVYNVGVLHLKRKQNEKAIESLTRAAAMKADDPFVQNNLGVAHENARQGEKAGAAFARASDLRPDNLTFAKNAGFAYVRLRRADQAVPYLERAHGLDANDSQVKVALAEMYTRQGRRADAMRLYTQLESELGDNAGYWFNVGVIRAETGDKAGAEQAYRRSLALNERDLDTLNNLGLLLYERGEYGEARTMFEKAAGLSPNSLAARLNLAAAAAKSGDLAMAIPIWRDVIRATPDRRDIRLQLANALWVTKDYDGARHHYAQVLAADRNNPEALNGIGLFHLKDDKLSEAEAAFRAAIASSAKFVPAYNNLAVTLERRNKRAEAIQILDRAQKIDPNNAEVNSNLQRMRAAG